MEKLGNKKTLGVFAALPAAAVLAFASLAVLPGCQTAPYEQADSQVNGAKTVKSSLVEGQKQVETTTKVLSELTDTTQSKDSRSLFSQYVSQISKVDAAGKNLAASHAAFKTASTNFLNARSAQINAIANPEVRTAADTRLKDAKAKFQALSAQIDSIQADYAPLVSQFNDIKTLLGNDLSKDGLNTASGVTKQVYEKANALRLKTNDVVATIDKFTAEVTPESAPKK